MSFVSLHLPTGFDDTVTGWKKRLNLTKVMAGKVGGHDRRTTSGLRKKVSRMTASKDPEVYPYKNLLKQVELAEHLMDTNMMGLSNEELTQIIDLLSAEGVTWAPITMTNLLKRRVAQMLSEKDFMKILPVIAPFENAPFDPKAPTAGALEETLRAKVDHFQGVVIRHMMTPLLSEGPAGEAKLLALSQQCLSVYEGLDFEELESYEASVMDELLTCWRCVVALLTTTIEPHLKVSEAS